MRDAAPTTSQDRLAEAQADTIAPAADPWRPTSLRTDEAAPRPKNRAALRVALDARKLTQVESGIGGYTRNLVRGLLQADDGLRLLLVRNRRPPQERFETSRVEDIVVPFPADSPLTPLTLGYFLRGQRFDLFHSPFDLVPRGLKQPVVVTVHDINWILNPAYNSHNPFMRLAGGFFYRTSLIASMNAARRIIAISNATRNAILEFAPWHEPKIRVIRHGLDRARVFPMDKAAAARVLEPLIDPASPFVLTVGQGSPYKNHFNAVRGFLEAFRDRPEYRMILVRRPVGADGDLERLLRSPQAKSRVITAPYVTPEVLNALYNRARIVLHPSYYEGFGLPLLEAMAAGVPIVTSSLSSMPEVVGPAALSVSPADSSVIARALRCLDEDEVLRERLIAAGLQRLGLFDWAEAARATLEVYREVARGAATKSK
jgi:glycosyltransferase involved in cell wall biosynthesis